MSQSYPYDPLQAFLKRLKLHVLCCEFAFQCRFVLFKYRPNIKIVQFLLTIKTLSQNISKTLSEILLKHHEHWGRYWRNKLSQAIMKKKKLQVQRKPSASKIDRDFFSLLCVLNITLLITNSVHLSDKAVVIVFPYFFNDE